jgi:uncharacterized membrane protein YfcA
VVLGHPFLGSYYFDFHSALGLTALFQLSSNLIKIFLFKQDINKRLLLTIDTPSVISVIVGGFLSKLLNSNYLEVFLVGFSLLFLIKSNIVVPSAFIDFMIDFYRTFVH